MYETEQKEQSILALREMQITNMRVLICYAVIAVVLINSYFIEILKGARTIPYVVFFIVILLAPLVISVFLYQKDDESLIIKHVVAIGYSVFYAFSMVTTTSIVGFAYVLPMMATVTLYRDAKYCLRTGVGAIIVNFGYILMNYLQGNIAKYDLKNYAIQMACIILVTIFMTVAAKTINDIFESKLKLIEEEQSKQSKLLEQIVLVTNTICNQINQIDNEAKQMKDKSVIEQQAAEEIAAGTSEVSSRLTTQQQMSSNITELTQQTSRLADNISDKFRTTTENTMAGSKNMEELIEVSKESKQSSATVEESVTNLTDKIREVEGILSLIDGVTKQTSLLSLNASIEAARAGEAGRGFAVVANNISQLAEQTKHATEDIKNIFEELSQLNEEAVQALGEMQQTSDRQADLITKSKENFMLIAADIKSMMDNVDQQAAHMQKVNNFNGEIAQNIEHIGGFADALSKSASNTRQITNENLLSVQNINELLTDVLIEIHKLEELK